MFDTIRSAAAYLFDIGVLIFFHELGHYLAARSQGVVVEAFSIGFGPALVSWRAKSGTLWKISVLPLGGYVKMQGWGEPDDGKPAPPGSFSATKLSSKAFIVAAGPIANLILAFVLFTGLFAINGQPIVQPVFDQIIPGSAAAKGGLLPGDRVLSIGATPIQGFDDMVPIIATHPDTNLSFTIKRAGVVQTRQIMIGDKVFDGRKIGSLGVGGDDVFIKHYSVPGAVVAAGQETWSGITTTIVGLYNLIVHQQGVHELRGMIGIAQITGKVAAFGIPSLINLIALLSINLGLVNLVPIPILDGGHLLFYAGEAVLRRPIPQRAQEFGLRIGFAVLLSLFVFTTFNDLTNIGAVRWVAHLFG
jgi:regulator of sigma E protease